jgi:putative membrane protein
MPHHHHRARRLETVLLLALLAIFIWSAIGPRDRLTWWLEAFPVIVGVPLLIAIYPRFRFTPLVYVLIFLHAAVLLVGAHYTYSEVPLFDRLRDLLGLSRNHYDRVGHFMQGFVPALIAREILLRTSPLRPGKWLFTIVVMMCMGLSAIYELIEWSAAAVSGSAADAFLATQGDAWDTQKDMALCGAGAVIALVLLSRVHDRQIARFA